MEAKKVVILGGSSGIGKATAMRFAKEGYRGFIGSSNLPKGNDVSAALPGEGHRAFEVDVRNSDQINALAQWIEAEVGSFDVLVNSVGVSQGMPALESEFENWDNALQEIGRASCRERVCQYV